MWCVCVCERECVIGGSLGEKERECVWCVNSRKERCLSGTHSMTQHTAPISITLAVRVVTATAHST